VKFEGDGLLKRYAVDEHARVNSYPGGVLTNLSSDHKSVSPPKIPYVLKSLHLQSNDVSPFRANAVATGLASPGPIASSGFGFSAVKRLAVGFAHPQARNRHRLALQGFPTQLERAIHLPHAARTEGGRQALTFSSPKRLMDKGKEPP
jgi:hypothetical protein